METKPLICKNCGGVIDRERMICPYCGTQYDWGNSVTIPHIIAPSKIEVFQIELSVPNDYILVAKNQKELGEFLRKDIAKKLAKEMESCIDFTYTEQPFLESTLIQGKIRILGPEYKF